MASAADPIPASNLPPFPHHSLTVATIDLSALAHNLVQIRRRLSPSCDILAVVKADAYGHGAVGISQALVRSGINRLGVATIDEGLALREAGVRVSVLVMGAVLPNQLPDLMAHQLTPVIHDPSIAARFAELAQSRPEPYPVHVKVDTGMGRLGLRPEEVLPMLQSPSFKGPLRAEGLMTHLADADNQNPEFTMAQLTRFRSVVGQLAAAGLSLPLLHVANSAAIFRHPSAHFSLVRPGIMLYGYSPIPVIESPPDLRPVLSLTTQVVQVRALAPGESVSYNRAFVATRSSRIAVLPIGYADGYNRSLSNRGHVLIHGCEARIVGRVCMDMTMVDVTDIPSVMPGDEAVLIGRQGSRQISAADLAAWLETIPYEILCAIGPRAPRVYR
ncbi:MAG: alanine racemase [Nitrospirae bacterium]|nr:alanine racemase [Nitrospirota bacterium]